MILVFDTETTGFVSKSKALSDPAQPHLVQLSALQYDPETSRIFQSLSLLIRPDDWEIPEAAAAVHGISTATAFAYGQDEKVVLTSFLHLWSGDDKPLLIVGHNAEFDKQIIAIAIERYFGPGELLETWLNTPHFCTMRESTDLVGAVTSNGRKKWPKLCEAYKHFFNEELENAHSANADTVATLKIYLALQP